MERCSSSGWVLEKLLNCKDGFHLPFPKPLYVPTEETFSERHARVFVRLYLAPALTLSHSPLSLSLSL